MNTDNKIDKYRRQFLASATAVAGLAIAPGVILNQVAHAKPADQPASSKNRWGMLIDSSKCSTGCNDCVTACNTENGITGFGRPTTALAPESRIIVFATFRDTVQQIVEFLNASGITCERFVGQANRDREKGKCGMPPLD